LTLATNGTKFNDRAPKDWVLIDPFDHFAWNT
jgi:hypothetical protein